MTGAKHEMVTVSEAAKRLGMSLASVRYRIKTKVFPATKKNGKWLIPIPGLGYEEDLPSYPSFEDDYEIEILPFSDEEDPAVKDW